MSELKKFRFYRAKTLANSGNSYYIIIIIKIKYNNVYIKGTT